MKAVAQALRDAGVQVKVLKEEFHAGAKDVEWLPIAANNGWILLTKDTKWRYHTEEKEILVNAKARVFVFASHTAKKVEIAETLVKCLPKMAQIIATVEAPFVAHILLSGHVTVLYPPA